MNDLTKLFKENYHNIKGNEKGSLTEHAYTIFAVIGERDVLIKAFLLVHVDQRVQFSFAL